MLLSFKVENYLSFKNGVTLNLMPSPIKEHEDTNVAYISTIASKVLKSAVIYGANSSGKSNLLKGLIFMKKFVENSSKNSQVNENINVESFRLNSVTEKKPSEFEVTFFHKGLKYRYGFLVDSLCVYKEWLYYSKVTKEYHCFTRTGNKTELDDKFTEGVGLENKTRSNALFLSVVAQFNGSVATEILEWFSDLKYINDLNKQYHREKTSKLLESNDYKKWIMKFLEHADLGFTELVAEKNDLEYLDLPKQLRDILGKNRSNTTIRTLHTKFDANGNEAGPVYFNLDTHESLGTQKLFSMAGLIIESLALGKVIIIDELDARLHPNLSASIIRLFNSKLNNPKNAQLIFVTHNTNLLSKDFFRRDQIILAKKDPIYGSTHLTPLINEKVRNDGAYEKNYLLGDYGAVPGINTHLNLFDNFI